jgi:hypothetical protein
MKMRNGFVSNSSSSSFLLALPEYPKNKNHLKKIIFGDKKYFYPWNDDAESWETEACTEILYKKMYHKHKVSFGKIFDAMHEFVYSNMIEDKPFFKDYYNKKILDLAFKKAYKFFNKHKDDFLFLFELSDNESDIEGVLEHGNIFEKFDYIQISHH